MISPAPGAKNGWLSRLKDGLSKTRVNIVGLFSGGVVDEAFLEDLEMVLGEMTSAADEDVSELVARLTLRHRQGAPEPVSSAVRMAARGRTPLVVFASPVST